MVGRKKKTKICDKGLPKDLISELPEALICDILSHLSTKEAVRTGVLSTRWRNLWKCVPGLDLDSSSFSDANGFVKFLDSHKDSWIRKLRLHYDESYVPPWTDVESSVTPWIDAVTVRRIQHLHVGEPCGRRPHNMPLSIYTCETLVHLRISWGSLSNAESVSLPCLKTMHLDCLYYPNKATLEKLISGSPVLEDLSMVYFTTDAPQVIQVTSQTLQRIHIDRCIQVVIDAPLLQRLRTEIGSTTNYKIITSVFPAKLNIAMEYFFELNENAIRDILADISRVKDLVITSSLWKDMFLYWESGASLEFRHLSRLNTKFSKTHLEMLPTILESCPKLESLILELVKDPCKKNNREPKVTFSTVPPCLVSSLKFVELKRLVVSRYEGETELVRYLLKNSTILEKFRLDVYYTKKAMRDFLKEVVAMPRCSSTCQVIVL